MNDATRRHAEALIDAAHPFGVAACEVIVDRDDVNAPAGQRVQIDRERRDERLSFASFHFGDAAPMQHHTAQELHVVMALAERALGGFPDGRKGLFQDGVETLSLAYARL